jgi:hypothetical protein
MSDYFTGQFRPGPEARPTIGTSGELEFVEEDKVEVIVNDKGQREEIKKAVKELKVVCLITACRESLTVSLAH